MYKSYIYNPETLVLLAREYLKAEKDAYDFSINHHMSYDNYLNLHERYRKNLENSWTEFSYTCERVNANSITVLSTVKSMDRHNRKHADSVKLPRGYNWNNHEQYSDTIRNYWACTGFPEEKPAFPWSE